MPSTTLYLGAPACGKSTLMRAHVADMIRRGDDRAFFIVDHDDTWGLDGAAQVYNDPAEWWDNPAPVAVFRGASGHAVAQLAIDVGWGVYVDDECDHVVGEWKDSPLREIVKRGRHLRNMAGIVCPSYALLATHRPANLPTDVVGLFDRVYIGKMQSHADAERIYREGWLQGRIEEIRDRLAAQPVGEFIVWPDSAN